MEQKKAANVDTNALIESVKNDMLNIERGKQWIMSSYSPFKDKAPFPGFLDDSFDEIRFGYYEAQQQTGRLDLYFQQVQAKHREATLRVKRLQAAPTPDFVSIFVQLYNTPALVTINTACSGYFGNTVDNSNIFASAIQHQTLGTPQAATSNNIFGPNANQSNPFANTTYHTKPTNQIYPTAANNLFGKPTAQAGAVAAAIFAQTSSSNAPAFPGSSNAPVFPSTSNTPIFAGSSNAPVFTASSNAPVFTGSSNAPVFSGSTNAPVFSGSSNAPVFSGSSNAPVFSDSSNALVFGGSSNAPMFGGGANVPVFGGSSNAPMFGGGSSNAPVFGASGSTALFGGTTTLFGGTSIFGGAPTAFGTFGGAATFGGTAQSQSSAAPPAAIFGAYVAPSTDIFGKSASFVGAQQFAGAPFGAATSVGAQPLFGGAVAASIFGGGGVATSQPSIFASNTVATSQPSIFASNTVATSQPSIFACGGASEPMSTFGGVASAAQTPIFAGVGSNTQMGGFSASPFVTPTVFGQQQQFGQRSSVATLDGVFADKNTPFALEAADGAIGASPFAAISPFISPPGVGVPGGKLTPRDFARTNPEYYSAELSDADLAAFRSVKFEFGAIPVDPPTVDLCA